MNAGQHTHHRCYICFAFLPNEEVPVDTECLECDEGWLEPYTGDPSKRTVHQDDGDGGPPPGERDQLDYAWNEPGAPFRSADY
jgi:hypothetical protein